MPCLDDPTGSTPDIFVLKFVFSTNLLSRVKEFHKAKVIGCWRLPKAIKVKE